MNRQVQKTGVRKYFGADLVELQSEPLAALDAFFAEYGPCVVQGCGITDNEDGTHDIAPGLVALTGTDPEGVQRVMVMPFAGTSGVALPLYLTPQAQVVERVYGDGKVKPVAHAYTAQAAGVLLNDPAGEPLPHLTLTAEGGNRFVDAVQDTAHRFISDAERTKWNGVLALAKAYADSVATTGSAAALRSAKEYTDARETAIQAEVDTKDAATLRTAKDYADRIVAALVDGSPEALNTLQELAAALGGDPNFATTVMQLIGERATMAQVNAALAGLQKTTIRLADDFDLNSLHTTGTYDTASGVNSPVPGFLYIDVIKHTGTGNWVSQTVYSLGGGNAPNRIFHRNGMNSSGWTDWVELWHTGNFDPAGAILGKGMRFDLADETVGTGFQYGTAGSGTTGPFITFGHSGYIVQMTTGHSSWLNENTRLRYRTRNGDTGTWSPWMDIYNSGNLGLATAAANGLMAAADKQKLDNIGTGGMKLLRAGVVSALGPAFGNRVGTWNSSKISVGRYRIMHYIGNFSYEVQATGRERYYASVETRGVDYVDIYVADDTSPNDGSFFFQIYEI